MKIDIVNYTACAVVIAEQPQIGTIELRPITTPNRMSKEDYENASNVIILRPASLGEDITSREIAELAASGKSFDFLQDPEEEIYTLEDGEPV